MNVARDNILQRVRAALRQEAHHLPAPTTSAFFPPIADPEARFREEFGALRGELIENEAALREFLKPFKNIATDGSELARQFVGAGNIGAREADLGVTSCDCLVAQTGSIVVSTRSTTGRAISVLPPAHLLVARRSQLVPDLTAALALLRQRYGKRWPSSLSIITGPSRTADIEKVLVMGAHGPKRLALYLVD